MKNNSIKIKLYSKFWSRIKDIHESEIWNLFDLNYTENIWWWQWEINISILTKYDDTLFEQWQLIEFSSYSKKNKNWSLRYIWFLKNIDRYYSQENWENILLELLWLWALLWEYSWSFNYSQPLNTIIDTFISQFHSIYNITNNMEFLWNSIYKNNITDTTLVNVNITWTYFDILKWIFNSIWKKFYISKFWEIILYDQSIIKHYFTLNKDVIEIKISSSRNTKIKLIWFDYNTSPWDKIVLRNINKNFNLDEVRIEKIDYSIEETIIETWEIYSLWSDILWV